MSCVPVDSLLMSLIEKEIPNGRHALIESDHNLAHLSAYCKENYMNSHDKRKALQETKEYTSQSLASVAYQIHSLAMNVLQMMDQQTMHLQQMFSDANNISLFVDIHKEKVARREIGVFTSNKNFSRSQKVVPPEQLEKVTRYKREGIDYSILDNVGHGGVRSELEDDDVTSEQLFSITSSSGSCKESSISSMLLSSPQPSLNTSIYKLNSSDRKGAFSSRVPLPLRPPIAPVAPSKVKNASLSTAVEPLPFVDLSSITPISSPLVDPYSITSLPTSNMPDYNGMDSKSLPLPKPPLPDDGDLYQIPSYSMPDTPSADLPPPLYTDSLYDGPDAERWNTNESVTPDLLAFPAPPSITLDGQIVPESFEEKVVAVYDYHKLREDELELMEGDVIYVIKKNEDGWLEGIKDGVQGLFPGNYVTTVM